MRIVPPETARRCSKTSPWRRFGLSSLWSRGSLTHRWTKLLLPASNSLRSSTEMIREPPIRKAASSSAVFKLLVMLRSDGSGKMKRDPVAT